MIEFHKSLSRASVFLRYFHMVSLDERVAHARLMQQCFIDYDREMALVADLQGASPGKHEIVAVARLTHQRCAGKWKRKSQSW
jgi:acetyltransferase